MHLRLGGFTRNSESVIHAEVLADKLRAKVQASRACHHVPENPT
jgi:hypothetical protein